MNSRMLLEKFAVGQVSYALIELESKGKDRALIVPLTREGDSLVGEITTESGKALADTQPGDVIHVLGIPETVLSVQLYEPGVLSP